ncbi:MAG: DUF4349 domain-containing protein, partial [Solirubrobacterales bacterium]
MRLTEREMPLDPDVERRLEAIDSALAGRPVDPDLEELAMLAAEIRGGRPEPSAKAEQMLDELAASGFPPRRSDRVGRATRRVTDAYGDLRRRGTRRLAPAMAAATVFLVAIGVGVSQTGVFNDGEAPSPAQTAPQRSAEADGGLSADSGSATRAKQPSLQTSGAVRNRAPAVKQSTPRLGSRSAAAPLAATLANRRQAQNVDLELSTSPDNFRDAADGVLDVVRDHHGFVLSSHVAAGDPGVRGARPGSASFDLRIPARELSAALGGLSDLGHVVSRTDGTLDITKRFVAARKRIDALSAARAGLLRQLGEAATIAEQQSLRARLRIVEARLAGAHQDLAKAQQRVSLVPVSVAIEATDKQASGGAWTIGDAFHDAGRVLTVAAGGALVGGAALLPLALLIVLTAAGWRGWVRRQRARALDAP